MCFSAEASFGAGIVLTGIGMLSVKQSKAPEQLLFASIPLLFAVQQFSEGLLWLALGHPKWQLLEIGSTYVFLLFAQVFWPAWVPLSILMLERNVQRKRVLYVLLALGLSVGIFLAYCFAVYEVSAAIVSYHISYTLDFPFNPVYALGFVMRAKNTRKSSI